MQLVNTNDQLHLLHFWLRGTGTIQEAKRVNDALIFLFILCWVGWVIEHWIGLGVGKNLEPTIDRGAESTQKANTQPTCTTVLCFNANVEFVLQHAAFNLQTQNTDKMHNRQLHLFRGNGRGCRLNLCRWHLNWERENTKLSEWWSMGPWTNLIWPRSQPRSERARENTAHAPFWFCFLARPSA